MDRQRVMLRLLAKLDVKGPDECWEWQGYKQRSGHGRIRIAVEGTKGGKLMQAHRLSWELFHGSLEPGQVVRHCCNNAACCNPGHLTVGTQQENVWDSIRSGTFKPVNGMREPGADEWEPPPEPQWDSETLAAVPF